MTRSSGRISLDAPAKINLGLRVTGRRDDGYHTLASLFVPIDLIDEVTVEIEPDTSRSVALAITGGVPGVPDDATNLAARAAIGFLEAAAIGGRVSVRLHKRIPAAAGLGGGSSDAGAVLRALRRLVPGALRPSELEQIALRLGADVPFFLQPRPAWVTGIGERCEPVADFPSLALVLVHPGTELSTAQVFRVRDEIAGALTPHTHASTMPALSGLPVQREGSDPRALSSLLQNDLEPAARRLCPAIDRLKDALQRVGAVGIGLSGSGPTLFGMFEGLSQARAAASALRLAPPAWVRVASRWTSFDPDGIRPDGAPAGEVPAAGAPLRGL